MVVPGESCYFINSFQRWIRIISVQIFRISFPTFWYDFNAVKDCLCKIITVLGSVSYTKNFIHIYEVQVNTLVTAWNGIAQCVIKR